jgi:hypothetical protein
VYAFSYGITTYEKQESSVGEDVEKMAALQEKVRK